MPIFVLSAHAFSDHKHGVCTSKIDKHFHEKEIDCKLDVYTINTPILVNNYVDISIDNKISKEVNFYYTFLINHYQLPFSLRGPPAF
ncbi:hypothetical protein [uncultured Polaribacter sp.]|uniref:hypothetical protein n=1 Tax=uncultured Polaribacter sp. TaxID=174711 RepID=UPI00260E53DB|nr:hypothetical protein [uncultured Polaribacter sp.]